MDINRIAAPAIDTLTLENFEEAAQKGTQVVLSHDGRQLDSIAQGQTPTTHRRVDWVRPNQHDSTSVFIEALGRASTSTIAHAIARELGLEAAPGKALASRTVTQSAQMAHTAGIAMAGVAFLEQMSKK